MGKNPKGHERLAKTCLAKECREHGFTCEYDHTYGIIVHIPRCSSMFFDTYTEALEWVRGNKEAEWCVMCGKYRPVKDTRLCRSCHDDLDLMKKRVDEELVKEHLAECGDCGEVYDSFKEHTCPSTLWYEDADGVTRKIGVLKDVKVAWDTSPSQYMVDAFAYAIQQSTSPFREFDTGATRNDDTNKNDYEACLSPLVLEAYADYVRSHRVQPDGTVRSDDNWQNLFGDDHYGVCMKSAWRHFMDMWKEHRGLKSREGMDAAICGVLFNVMAYYHKRLLEKGE